MTHFRIRYLRAGGHAHLRVFAGPGAEKTHGKCGDLTMTLDEFDDLRRYGSTLFEFVDEEVRGGEEDRPR